MSAAQIRLQREPIDVGAIVAAAGDGGDGAVSVFVGRVRDRTGDIPVEALEYTAYHEMAERVIGDLARATLCQHAATSATVVHRLGRLGIGEISMVVAVSAPHRQASITSCQALVDGIKADAPIFKREVGPNGVRWAEA